MLIDQPDDFKLYQNDGGLKSQNAHVKVFVDGMQNSESLQ